MSAKTEIHVIDYSTQNPGKFFLVNDFLSLRKKVFVDKLGWTIDTYQDLEFDQYDTFQSKYVVATVDDAVVGGARLLCTSDVTPSGFGATPYTYMIKDAHDGVLDGLPHGLCYETPPVQSDIWEITRLCSTSKVISTQAIMDECILALKTLGAKKALFICSPAGVRYAKRNGRIVYEIGPVHENEDCKFQAISFNINGERNETK